MHKDLHPNIDFGVCPECGETDGYINIGKTHWFYCKKHKVKWNDGGYNNLVSWMDETNSVLSMIVLISENIAKWNRYRHLTLLPIRRLT